MITIFLVLVEVLLGRRIPDQPYSGVLITNLSVERVAPGSPGGIAGFRKGDKVLAVEGVPCSNSRDISRSVSRVRPGDKVTYQVRRGERTLLVPVLFSRPPPSEILRKSLIIFVGLSFVAIGLVVYYRRSDKIALLFYLLCLTFGLVLTNIVNFEVSLARHPVKAAFYDLLVLALPALFLHFFLTFPGKSPILRRYPLLEYLAYLPGVLLFAISRYLNAITFAHGSGYAGVIAAFENISGVYFAGFVVLGLAAFVRSYQTTSTASLRAKLKLVVWGTLLGTLPLVCVRVVLSVRPDVEIPGERLVFLPLVLVPAAFGHAIVRHRLMDLEIVLKRSLVYTILTAVLAAFYFAVVYGIGRIASRYIGRADLPFSVIAIFCISLLISPLRSRIRASVEKLFFRDEYNYRKVLRQISHSLAGIVELDNLLGFLATRTGEVLHSQTVAIYLREHENGDYTARCAVNADPVRLGKFPTGGGLIACLRSDGQTLNVERGRALDMPLPLSEAESAVLASIDSALVVPLSHKSDLLGFMSIGRRLGSGYYAGADIELLETLCDQASVAIENARLYLEAVEKHKMEQELEVAREIQSRLLPKGFPEIRGLKTHGLNVPSKHVGGDYYDVLPLGAGKVAVIIADVSGKGVPAALLMASLQSSLRPEADARRAPSEVIGNLNATIYEHTSGDTFVTIFYGVIDFERELLTYCSAGHPPPFIVRRDLSSERLDKTDLVLGIESRPAYNDNQVPIGPGDLLFLYTDGITDELDDREDPYGEDSLLAELRKGYDLTLEDLVERVYHAVLRHTGGKCQDDLTALAVRIESLRNHPPARPTGRPPVKTPKHLA